MFKTLLITLLSIFLYADSINFDFIDARKKGYTDKEILDYVSKNLNNYDINSLRQTGISDRDIVDFFIQKDSVNTQLKALSKSMDSRQSDKQKIYPKKISSTLAFGCLIYNGTIKNQNDGWLYMEKLKDFASAIYTTAYLKGADYFDVDKSQSVSLKNICSIWIKKLKNKDEIDRLYAVSLTNEIENIVKQKKSLSIE